IGIALLLFAVFLAGALIVLAAAELRTGIDVRSNVGWVGWYLARPLVALVGWPAAVLIPLVPAVHALRLFGRLESETDRSWMIFFAGMVLLLPIALALALPAPAPGLPSAGAGIWGGLIAAWWTSWFGAFGAWVVVALAASVLMAATLAWNPVRMLIGRRAPVIRVLEDAPVVVVEPPRARKRLRKGDAGQNGDTGIDGNLALALEPSPDEMPA